MKVGVDGTAFEDGASGIARRTLELFARVPAIATDVELTVFVAPPLVAAFRERLPSAEIVALPQSAGSPARRLFGHNRRLRDEARRRRLDVLHQDTLPLANPAITLPTLHDLRDATAEWGRGGLRAFYLKRIAPPRLRRCPRIIAVSEAMKEDVVRFLGVAADRVVVVPNGVDRAAFAPAGPDEGARGNELLFVGHREPRKNIPFLVDVLAELRARGRDVTLVVAGRPVEGHDAPERRARRRGVVESIRFEGRVSEERLKTLYREATCLLMPSRYEGFGMPVLEAMAAGAPVLCANRPPFPEVAGPEACLPEDEPTVWADAIEKLIDDPEARRRARAVGDERVAFFSWERAAETLVQVWRDIP